MRQMNIMPFRNGEENQHNLSSVYFVAKVLGEGGKSKDITVFAKLCRENNNNHILEIPSNYCSGLTKMQSKTLLETLHSF